MITVKISDYVAGRYNKSKLEKLKVEIEKELNKFPGYISEELQK